MKPCAGDVPVRAKISGAELRELKKLTGAMAEAFGLDRRIEAYQGKRPIQFYRWDLDCLEAVVDGAVREAESCRKRIPGLRVLKRLQARIHELVEEAYRDLKGPRV